MVKRRFYREIAGSIPLPTMHYGTQARIVHETTWGTLPKPALCHHRNIRSLSKVAREGLRVEGFNLSHFRTRETAIRNQRDDALEGVATAAVYNCLIGGKSIGTDS